MSSYSHEEYSQRRYFSELDGVRALSVLLVFTTHLDVLFWERLQGSTGVTFFFVLSGYLITTLALREEAGSGHLSLTSFYTRRVFRIYPLYLVVLGIYCTLILGLGMAPERRDSFVHSLPYYLAFLPEQALLGWQGVEPPFSGAWSLGIEEKFYFVWPLLGFVVLAGRFRGRIVTLLVTTVLFAMGGLLGEVGILVKPYALLSLGCLVAVLLHEPHTYERFRRLGEGRTLGLLVALLIVVQFGVPGITLRGPLYVAYGVLVTAVLVGILIGRSRVGTVLSLRPLVFLGRISYAFYLTHNFAINGVQGALPDTPVMQGVLGPALALPVAIAIAWGLHVTVEKPMIKIGHRLAHRPKAWRALPVDPPAAKPQPASPSELKTSSEGH
ncbi:acyltransferase family protein [Nocardioides sp.]|uniref:acyltransferase family protein n=1 Tax=Nocardioides sp. TaxID=35761 RepID=UPI003562682A